MPEHLLLAAVLALLATGAVVWLLAAVLALVGVGRTLLAAVRWLTVRPAAPGCGTCGGDMETCFCGGRPLPQPRPYAGGAA